MSQLWPSPLQTGCSERPWTLQGVSCSDGALPPFFPVASTHQPREGVLVALWARAEAVPAGKQHQGYQQVVPLGQVLAPPWLITPCQDRPEQHRQCSSVCKGRSHGKKNAVLIMKPGENGSQGSLCLNVHGLKVKEMLSEKQNKCF